MFKANSQKNEELDRLSRLILKSASADEETVEAAATAPFLFARVRAGIKAEGRKEETGSWLSLILVARRAIPVMALVAILAAVITLWSAGLGFSSTPAQVDDEALFGPTTEPGVEQAVLARGNGLSRDEVFNIVVDRNYGVSPK